MNCWLQKSVALFATTVALSPLMADLAPDYRAWQFPLTENASALVELEWESCLLIYWHGEERIRLNGYRFFPAVDDLDFRNPWASSPSPTDLNIDGHPDWIVFEWSGGAHCCRTIHVISFIPEPILLASLDLADSWIQPVEDMDGDGYFEVKAHDWTFAYWNAPFALSPAPRIVLTIREDGIYLNPALMLKDPPTQELWQQWLNEIGNDAGWNAEELLPPPLLWEKMLDLIYQGHPHLAERILLEAWPESKPGRSDFRASFYATLATSPWYQKLQPPQKLPTI